LARCWRFSLFTEFTQFKVDSFVNPLRPSIFIFAAMRYSRCRLSAATYSYVEETISPPSWGAARFGPLGPTPLRDSRYTFRFRGLARDYPFWTFPEFTRLFDPDYSGKRLTVKRDLDSCGA